MKSVSFVALAFAVLATPAFGADLPARSAPYLKAPPLVTGYNWSGCYVGAYVNAAGRTRVRASEPASQGGTFAAGTAYNGPGSSYAYRTADRIGGGGTVGCNWQAVGSHFVAGLEGEVGYLRSTGGTVDPNSLIVGGDTFDSTRIGNINGVGAVRFGYALDRFLVYGKAGVSVLRVSSSVTDTCVTAPCGTGTLIASSQTIRVGYALGGGLEYALTNNWSVKAEYLRLGMTSDYSVCGAGGGAATGSTFCSTHRINGIDTVKIGLNYKFGSDLPIVARY